MSKKTKISENIIFSKGLCQKYWRTEWEPRIGPILTDDDARQIAVNVTGFFSILAEWARLETPTPANDTGKPSPSVDEEARHDR